MKIKKLFQVNRVFVFALVSVFLGLLAASGSALLGIHALKLTSNEIEHQIGKFYLAKAISLASLSTDEYLLSDQELLAEIQRVWKSDPDLPSDEYICVVDNSARLLMHSSHPNTIGNHVGNNLIIHRENEARSTLSELIKSNNDYIGDYVSSKGELQVAAFSKILNRDWVIGVHRSKHVVDENISEIIETQYWGLLIISLFIIPVVLLLMYYFMLKITRAQQQVEDELKWEQSLLRSLMENTQDNIYFKDLKSRFIKINQSQANYLNLESPEQALGKTDFDYFNEEHAKKALESEEAIMETGEPAIGMIEKHVWPDKNDTWSSSSKQALRDENGNIIGTFGVSRDITETIEARNELDRQTQFLKSVLDSLQHPFMVINAKDYTVEHANAAAKEAAPLGATTCYAMSHKEASPCKDSQHPCPVNITKSTKKPATVEHIHYDKQGKQVEHEVHSYPIFNNEGEVVQVIEYSLDISKRREAEKALMREYDLQAVLYQIASAGQNSNSVVDLGHTIHDSLGHILDTKNFYIAIGNANSEKLSFPVFVDENDENPGTIPFGNGMTEYLINSGQSLLANASDIHDMHDTGNIKLVGTPPKIWLGTPMRFRGENIGAIVVQNYNDANRYDESHVKLLEFVSSQIAISLVAKQAEEKLAMSEGLKDLTLDIITHDLKNPIALIYNFSELALAKTPDDHLLEQIYGSSSRLLKILDNTTVLSQTIYGESIPLETISLHKMLEEIVEESKPLASQVDMTIQLNCPLDLKVSANPILGEVFKNYISNAMKYAKQGKQILVQVEEKDGIQISVMDLGDTIPESERENIFLRNVQLSTEKKVGRGLGLSIVKRIAEAHQAEVWVEPNTPRGNRFNLRLPLNERSES